ncbi:MAG: copper resistance CopC family protein [Caulobacteraceae bacterium]
MRAVLAIALLASALSAGEAHAHAQLVKAEPAVGSAVARAPSVLKLRFTEVPRLNASGVQLTPPSGAPVLLTPLRQDPKDVRTLVAPLPGGLAAGRYKVEWRVLSPDGHRTKGDYSFTISP